MRHRKVFLLFIFVATNLFSQNYDSLFYEYINFRSPKSSQVKHDIISSNKEGRKCGFGLAEILLENIDKLSTENQNILHTLTDRPVTDTSIVSPDGYFRIHFNKSGTYSPKYDVNTLAAAFDSAYNFEVKILGFLPPPKDGTEGGDDKYDVYIQSLGAGSYGETRFTSINNGKQYVSYTLVDNSFSSVPTSGIDGAIVTAAHEFHHAIQVGNYGWNNDQIYFYELTSTSMEEFVFDDINDYYYYLPSYFRKPSGALSSYSGYELAHWNIYLKEKFEKTENDFSKGFEIIKRTWDIFKENKNSIEAISLALFENGTTLSKEFLDFGLWCYYTGSRVDDNYFSEGKHYPKIKALNTYAFISPQKQYSITTNPVSNTYIYFTKTPSNLDTLVSVISNCDIKNYLPINQNTGTYHQINLTYNLYDYHETSSTKIVDNYYSLIESDKNDLLKEGNIYNNTIVNGQDFKYAVEDYAFPQPFSYGKYDNIYIPAANTDSKTAELKIFSVDMNLIYSGTLDVHKNDKIFVGWNVKSNSGEKLPTGVYLYVSKSEGKIKKGKFVVYNE